MASPQFVLTTTFASIEDVCSELAEVFIHTSIGIDLRARSLSEATIRPAGRSPAPKGRNKKN